jgi:hypothetical protein
MHPPRGAGGSAPVQAAITPRRCELVHLVGSPARRHRALSASSDQGPTLQPSDRAEPLRRLYATHRGPSCRCEGRAEGAPLPTRHLSHEGGSRASEPCRPTRDLAWANGALLCSDDPLRGPWPRHPLAGIPQRLKLSRGAGLTRAGARRGAISLTCMREFRTPPSSKTPGRVAASGGRSRCDC